MKKSYGLLVEGDYGALHFQGTRFLEFEREIAPAPLPYDQPAAEIGMTQQDYQTDAALSELAEASEEPTQRMI